MASTLLKRETPRMGIVPEDVRARLAARPLHAGHGEAFRILRLEALQHSGNYLSLFKEEHKHTAAQWRQRCLDAHHHRVFGLFDGERLLGALAAMKWDDPEWPDEEKGHTVLWGSAYLTPACRGQKMMAPLYQAREEWTKERFRRAVFFIREGNTRAVEIHEKRGAQFLYAKPMRWADGSYGPARWYQKDSKILGASG